MRSSFDLFWLKTRYNMMYFATLNQYCNSYIIVKKKVLMVIQLFAFTMISLFLFYKGVYKMSHKKYTFLRICVIFILFMNVNQKCLSNIMFHATNIKILIRMTKYIIFSWYHKIELIHNDNWLELSITNYRLM